MYTVAVDIGGTFTDVVVIDESFGAVAMGKVLSTPADLQEGVVAGLEQAASCLGLSWRDLLVQTRRFVHATTRSTNAVFERSGARTAVITTRGFGDTLMIMRATGRVAGLSVFARHHYRTTDKPRPLAGERDIFEVSERVNSAGNVVIALDEAALREIAAMILARGYQAVAVAFLFAHKNPVHERWARDILEEELPGVFVTTSEAVAPVLGEYERSATALFNAYVGPIVEEYLGRLEQMLTASGLAHRLLVVQSNGGIATVPQTVPIFTVESGPAAGVVGSAHLAAHLGQPDVIATDVGGTTFKVAIIKERRWAYRRETVLDQYQLRLPMVDLTSIGAGGGSIAWTEGRRLRIGPKSAGSDPGPACYGRGGREPTVTDADLVLGYLSPDRFLGGRIRLDTDRAQAAISGIADTLFDGDLVNAAAGIRQVTDSQMADLIRKTTLERGHDPRAFALMAYGGAGPLHAATYATEAGCTSIIVPYQATVHSAYGAALSDVRFSLRFSDPIVLPTEATRIEAIYAAMEQQGTEMLEEANVPKQSRRFERWVEARYRRQVHTVRVPVRSPLNEAALAQLARDFEEEYARLFGPEAALRDAGVELVDYGVDAVGVVERYLGAFAKGATETEPYTARQAYCPIQRAMIPTPIYDGPALAVGTAVEGPAIVEHPGTTILILSNQRARIDDHGHTHIKRKEAP
jgi:N-methylhydantoinase A